MPHLKGARLRLLVTTECFNINLSVAILGFISNKVANKSDKKAINKLKIESISD